MLNNEEIPLKIFEYHEGLLNSTEKVELMEFLHNHPEWNHDFAISAQSRLSDEPVPVPAFAKNLKKKSPPVALWKSFLRISTETISILGLAYLMSIKPEINISEPSKSTPLETHHSNSKIVTEQGMISKKISDNRNNTKGYLKAWAAPLNTASINEDDNAFSLTDNTNLGLITPEIKAIELFIKEPVFRMPKKVSIKKELVIKKRKNKKFYPKQKFSLKPTSKIVPQNNDF